VLVPIDEPEPMPMLPVVPGELPPLPLPAPTVPVVRGTPALPTPVPKFGVTVVLPGPGPPGTPAPEELPGWPAAAPPGEVAPTLPLDVPVPLEPLLLPPLCAKAMLDDATTALASSGMRRTRIGTSCGGSFGQRFPRRLVPTNHGSGYRARCSPIFQRWCGREDSNLHGLPR
jgi:hypothetical protein